MAILSFVGLRAGDEGIVQNEGVAMKSDKLVSIGIGEEQRAAIAQKLNTLLADEYALYIRTQKFHWNVVGPFFGPLHKLFNDQFDALAENVDAVAERIRALGFKAIGTLAEFKQNTALAENPGVNPDANSMIGLLLEGHEAIIKSVRPIIDLTAQLNEMGTNNFLAGLLEKHEKAAWFLRAHLLSE
jgi:starvation-inducible DNA-binding protein